MNKGKLETMIRKNLMMENRHIRKNLLLKEGSNQELETKRQNIISYLEDLKSQNSGFDKKIQGYIDDMKSINVDSVCNGTNLSSEIKKKLDDAKSGLGLAKIGAKDKNKVIPKIEQEIPFIESFCSTKTQDNKPNTSQQTNQTTQGNQQTNQTTGQTSGLQRTPSSQQTTGQQSTQGNQSNKIPDSERRPKFMDELDRLNSDQKFTKQDIIDYVKSKVVIKTA